MRNRRLWRRRRPWPRFPVAFRPTGIRFLGIRYPPGNWAFLTVGLPTCHLGRSDPVGVSVFHTRETRLGKGVLCTPGTTVSTRLRDFCNRRLPHHNGIIPVCPAQLPDPDSDTKGSQVNYLGSFGRVSSAEVAVIVCFQSPWNRCCCWALGLEGFHVPAGDLEVP